jgi:hypothetical protein
LGRLFLNLSGHFFFNLSGHFFSTFRATFFNLWSQLFCTFGGRFGPHFVGAYFFTLLGHTFGGNFKQRRKPRSQAPPFLFDAYSGRLSSDCAPPLLRRRSWPRCSDFLRLLFQLAFNFLDAGFVVLWRCPISDGQKNTGFFATQIPTAVRALFGEPGFARYGDRNSGWQKIWYYFQDL